MAIKMSRQTIGLYFLLGNERLMLEIVWILVRYVDKLIALPFKILWVLIL